MTKVISFRRKRGFNTVVRKQSYKKKPSAEMIKNERNKFLLTLISIAALLCGSIFYKFFPDITVNSIIESKIFLLQTGSFLQILLFLIKLDIIFIAVTFFTGTSFIGSPIVFLPPFFKCLIIGYIGSYFYNVFELKGVLFCLLLIYPYFVVTTSSLIFAANESIHMSNYNLSLLRSKNTADDISVRLYLMRYLLLCIINLVCAAVNSAVIAVLAPRIILR